MPTYSLDALLAHTEDLGYTIAWHNQGHTGLWYPGTNTISLRNHMSDVDTLCTLAHELGHATHMDPGGHNQRYEQRADRYAADLLVSPVEYKLAETLYGPSAQLIAAELGVTVWIINTWREMWETTGHTRGQNRG